MLLALTDQKKIPVKTVESGILVVFVLEDFQLKSINVQNHEFKFYVLYVIPYIFISESKLKFFSS